MPKLRNVVFDLGGVLVDWNPDYLYRKLIPDSAARQQFLSEVCHSAWNAQQDRGRNWAEAIAERVARFPHQADLIRAYRERWIEMIGGVMPETVALLDALKARGTPLYALTNWAADTFEEARDHIPLDRFDGIVVSGKVMLAKPEAAIFELLLRQYGLRAAETLFIDDMPYNTAAADALGFTTVTFKDAAQLKTALLQHGLL